MSEYDIQISERGFLSVKRGNQLKEQFCPFSPPGDAAYPVNCGDWCPLFGEPHVWENGDIHIDICHDKTLWCSKEKFQDLRVI